MKPDAYTLRSTAHVSFTCYFSSWICEWVLFWCPLTYSWDRRVNALNFQRRGARIMSRRVAHVSQRFHFSIWTLQWISLGILFCCPVYHRWFVFIIRYDFKILACFFFLYVLFWFLSLLLLLLLFLFYFVFVRFCFVCLDFLFCFCLLILIEILTNRTIYRPTST